MSPADVLRLAGLPPGLFDQEKIFVSTEELFAFYRAIGEASPDPAIGLKLGAEERVERYDPIALGAVSARSLRDALAAARALQAVDLPGSDRRRRARRRVPRAVPMAPRGGDGAAAADRRVLRRGGGPRPPGVGRGHPAQAHRASRFPPRPRDVRVALRVPGEVRGPAEPDRVQPGRPRPALPHPQRGPVRFPRTTPRGRAEAGDRFEGRSASR